MILKFYSFVSLEIKKKQKKNCLLLPNEYKFEKLSGDQHGSKMKVILGDPLLTNQPLLAYEHNRCI